MAAGAERRDDLDRGGEGHVALGRGAAGQYGYAHSYSRKRER